MLTQAKRKNIEEGAQEFIEHGWDPDSDNAVVAIGKKTLSVYQLSAEERQYLDHCIGECEQCGDRFGKELPASGTCSDCTQDNIKVKEETMHGE